MAVDRCYPGFAISEMPATPIPSRHQAAISIRRVRTSSANHGVKLRPESTGRRAAVEDVSLNHRFLALRTLSFYQALYYVPYLTFQRRRRAVPSATAMPKLLPVLFFLSFAAESL